MPVVRRDVLQVLLNLVVNAEAALVGVSGPTLRLVVGRSASGGATLSVEDNGPGVPPARRDLLFAGTIDWPPPAAENLGIGLTVSRALAERAGGTLAYTPRHPSGAVFTLSLPAA